MTTPEDTEHIVMPNFLWKRAHLGGSDYYMKISETQEGRAIYKRVIKEKSGDHPTEYTRYALADSKPMTFFASYPFVGGFYYFRGKQQHMGARAATFMPVSMLNLEVRDSEQMRLWLAELLPAGRNPEVPPPSGREHWAEPPPINKEELRTLEEIFDF